MFLEYNSLLASVILLIPSYDDSFVIFSNENIKGQHSGF